MNIEVEEIYTETKCRENMKKLYVFGENERQRNTKAVGGGQAIIRACPNSFGFCTLSEIGKPWSDKTFALHSKRIDDDIHDLRRRALAYDAIVFPKYGLGTGRAMMIQNAPLTFLYLCSRLLEEFEYNNIYHLSVPKF